VSLGRGAPLRYRGPLVSFEEGGALVRMRVVGAGLALMALVTAGACGDDGGGGDRLTQAELAARGDAVCTRLDGEVKAVAAEFEPSITFTPEQMQDLWGRLVPKVDAAIADFEELEPPEDLEAKLDEAVAQAKSDRGKLVDAAKSPEAAKILFDSQEDPFTATNEKLAAVGITACTDDAAAEGGAETTTSTPAETTTTAP